MSNRPRRGAISIAAVAVITAFVLAPGLASAQTPYIPYEHETDDRHKSGEPDAADELERSSRRIVGASSDRGEKHDDRAESAERPHPSTREEQSPLHANQRGDLTEHVAHHLRLTR